MGSKVIKDYWGGTPLHDAAENGELEVGHYCIHETIMIYTVYIVGLITLPLPSLSAVKSYWPIKQTPQTKMLMVSQQQTWQSTTDTMNVPDISVPWRKM